MRKLLRQIVGVHVLIGRDEHLFAAAGFDEREIPAPLIFHPHGVEVLRSRAEDDHDFGAIERRENVRLIRRAELILERDARKKDLEALLRELVVEVVGKNAVRRAASTRVRLLVADEHVKRLFLLRDGEDALLNFVDRAGFFLVELALREIGILDGGLVVVVIEYGGELRAVDRRDAFVRRRVLDVLDAVPAENERPVRLGVGAVLVQDLLIQAHRLVKLVIAAEVVGAVVEIGAAVIVQPRERLLRTAAVAHADGSPRLKLHRPAAHFAFEYCHDPISLLSICFLRLHASL